MTKTKNTKTPKSESKNKPTLVVLLLDRTGSMETCKQETISGFNGYLDGLKKDKNSDAMRFSLTQFDSQSTDHLAVAAPLDRVNRLNDATYVPRGGTPLYDAMGAAIESAKEGSSKYKVLFVTLTDGEENASSKWNLDQIRSLISKREKEDHWTFAFIGVGLDGFNATSRMAHGTISASNILRSSHKDTGKAYRKLASVTLCYSGNKHAGGQSVNSIWSGGADEAE